MVKNSWGWWSPVLCSEHKRIKRKDGFAVCGCGEIIGEFDIHIIAAKLVGLVERDENARRADICRT